jgi:hypothetical protein
VQGAEGGNLAHVQEERAFPAGDVVELGLLFPAEAAAALESEARRRGLTLGEMLRRLVRDFLTRGGRTAASGSS